MHKLSNPSSVIAARRGDACTSVTAEMPTTIQGVVVGEFLFIYEGKPSYKLVVESNGEKYRVSGYDACMEGDTISLTKKDVVINGKQVYWYTMDAVVTTPTKAKATKKANA